MGGSNSKSVRENDPHLEQKSLQNVVAGTEKEFKLLKNTRLDIAFTGDSGVGKSSLVNAFRNVPDYGPGAAKVGTTQTTNKPEGYLHPKFPGITLWDLPGIGAGDFKPKDYLKKVNFSRYDFFILVASDRFTVHHTMLAAEIQKMKKKFYFVRSKLDQAMNAERKNPEFDEAQALETIRQYCLSNLIDVGAVNPSVFLISSWHLDMYDYRLLQKTLANDLNDLKRLLLLMAMPAFSREHLQEKKAAMEAIIWKRALLSCAVGATPVPGVSLIFDVGLVVSTMIEFCTAFGLDGDSLHNLAKRAGRPVDVLRSAVKKTPMANQISAEFVLSLSSKTVLYSAAMVLEEVSDLVPVLGSLMGGVNSFNTTYFMLKGFLQDAVEDAENVLSKVLN